MNKQRNRKNMKLFYVTFNTFGYMNSQVKLYIHMYTYLYGKFEYLRFEIGSGGHGSHPSTGFKEQYIGVKKSLFLYIVEKTKMRRQSSALSIQSWSRSGSYLPSDFGQGRWGQIRVGR